MRAIEIIWPYPPTGNKAYRNVNGRMVKAAAFRDYSKAVSKEIFCHPRLGDIKKLFDKRIAVDIWAYPPDKRKRDLDNLGKVLLDSLQAAGVFRDDSQVDDLRFRRGINMKPGKVIIKIHGIEILET